VLLGLWSDPGRSNADVKAIAKAHVRELEERARQLNEMANALRTLADACDGDGRPDCPIIASLETGADAQSCHPSPAATAPAPSAPRAKVRAGR
jgi:MerR family gold-responsive transcriptional activator of gol and ges genes